MTAHLRDRYHLAEREGFEPPDRRRSTVFKTAAFNHSATSPKNIADFARPERATRVQEVLDEARSDSGVRPERATRV